MRKTAVALPDLLAPKKFRILLNSNFQNQFQNIRKFKKKNRETKIDKRISLKNMMYKPLINPRFCLLIPDFPFGASS